jgi:hypothetical protein
MRGANPQQQDSKIDAYEVIESVETIKQRLESIFGCSHRASNTALQDINMRECALLIATLICCSCHWWLRELLNHYANIKLVGQEKVDHDASEESLVEEMWVMSRSHLSILHPSLQATIDEDTKVNRSQQSFPSYQEFGQLYTIIKQHCLVRVSPQVHPLVSYATKTLLSSKDFCDSDRKIALDVLDYPSEERIDISSDTSIQSAIVTWRRTTHFSHWLSSSTEHQDFHAQVNSLLVRSYYVFSPMTYKINHSCAPTLLMTVNESNNTAETVRGNKLSWLVLHDMTDEEASTSIFDSLDADINSRNIELKQLMGRNFVCTCVRCNYESKVNRAFTPRELKRLGDLAMQQSRFEDATKIYQSILDIDPSNADAFHAKAASFLGRASSTNFGKLGHCQGFFLQAQHLWNQAAFSESLARHPDISVIIQKLCAYGTIQNLQPSIVKQEKYNDIASSKQYECSSYLDGKVFITNDNTPIISTMECLQVIKAAEDHAKQTGWTTSRHYSVPTTDIPLHELDASIIKN